MRRGGAPKGDAHSAESAPAEARKVRKGLASEGGEQRGAPFGALPPSTGDKLSGQFGRTIWRQRRRKREPMPEREIRRDAR